MSGDALPPLHSSALTINILQPAISCSLILASSPAVPPRTPKPFYVKCRRPRGLANDSPPKRPRTKHVPADRRCVVQGWRPCHTGRTWTSDVHAPGSTYRNKEKGVDGASQGGGERGVFAVLSSSRGRCKLGFPNSFVHTGFLSPTPYN